METEMGDGLDQARVPQRASRFVDVQALLGTSQRQQAVGARKRDRGQKKKIIRKIKGPKQRLRRRDSGGKHTSPVRGWGGVESNDLQETREKRTATERSPVQWNVESLDPSTGL